MTLASWEGVRSLTFQLIYTTWTIQGHLLTTGDIETEVTNLIFHRPLYLDSLYWKWPLVGRVDNRKRKQFVWLRYNEHLGNHHSTKELKYCQ